MTSTDYLGNPLSVGVDGQQPIDDFVSGLLGYEKTATNVVVFADKNPDACLANAYCAVLNMFLESPDGPPLALPYLEKAEAAAPLANRREQMNVAAIRAWYDNDMPRAIRIGNEILDEFPRDLVTVKLTQTHCFNLGNAAGMLSVAHKAEKASADICHTHGMTAFAYEQCHLLAEAEKSAWLALEMKRKEPWAHHALAHVMITQGRIVEGVEFLSGVSDTWSDLNSFMLTHNWWHLALNYISLGRFEDALDLYDNQVWNAWKDYSQDQINAISLLGRLELAGVDVGDRWQEVGDRLKVRVRDFVQPFLTMHYIYGLARAGKTQADELLENLQGYSGSAPDFVKVAWQDVALPACEGLIAHARGNHGAVIDKLGPAIPRLQEIGGSHAQRDFFDQVLLDSTIHTGRYDKAQQMLEMRRGYEPESIPNNTLLAMVYENLGLPREAVRASARVQATLA